VVSIGKGPLRGAHDEALAGHELDELVHEDGAGPFGPTERPMGGYVTLPAAWHAAPANAVPWVTKATRPRRLAARQGEETEETEEGEEPALGRRGPDPGDTVVRSGSEEALDPRRGEAAEDRVDLFGRGRDVVVVEPPDEEAHAGAGDELHGSFELGRVDP
jgi:hypothetical protein